MRPQVRIEKTSKSALFLVRRRLGAKRMWEWVSKYKRRPPTAEPRRAKSLEELTKMFFTTRTYPIYYLPITKCGSTFLKNVLYALDYGVSHPDGEDVHSTEQGLVRSRELAPEVINQSPYAFTVLREPRSRFLSVYFDKIYSVGPRSFPRVRADLESEHGVDLSPRLTAAQHTNNCMKLLDFIESNLKLEPAAPMSFHWRPQAARMRRAHGFEFVHLTLDGLDWQLPQLVQPLIPDMAEHMRAVTERNTSTRPVAAHDVLTPELLTRLEAVYAADFELLETAQAAWAPLHPRAQGVIVPAQPPETKTLRGIAPKGAPFMLVTATPDGAQAASRIVSQLEEGQEPELVDHHKNEVFAVALVESPITRVLNSYASQMVLGRSEALTRHLRAGGAVPRVGASAEVHRAAFSFFLNYIRRRLRLGGDASQIWMRQQAPMLDRALAAGAVSVPLDRVMGPATVLPPDAPQALETALSALTLPAPPAASLPDDLLSAELEDRIHEMYRADIDHYTQACARIDAPQDGRMLG